MSLPNKSVICDKLNQTKHPNTKTIQRDLFSSIDAQNEYWLYSDLHNLYDNYFPITCDTKSFVQDSLIIPSDTKLSQTDFYNQHVVTIKHDYNIHDKIFHNETDLKLSRYACWCMTLPHPALMFSRTYFMAPLITNTPTFENIYKQSYQFARIPLRNQLRILETQLAGILQKLGTDYKRFKHDVTQILFNGYTSTEIKNIYCIPKKSNDPISNYMGAASLNTKIRALRTTIKRFDMSRTKNLQTLTQILTDEIIASRRQTYCASKHTPEDDIFTTPISAIEKKLKEIEKQFIQNYSHQSIR